ncbi:type II secretion system protein GspM [Pararhodobacter zhoushanensis]|uniref:type II secretion system protein GspM n=1 Tax=Pararhodobacter zhoushanensis TaxID=2479545 RepID=UPI000F8D84EB|nr:type II secretion system protein GspM [Pararhodobacter zhoushanensis]
MIAALARLLAGRSPRERLLLALLALGALPVAFVALVALPLMDARTAARADLAAAQAVRDWYAARQLDIAALPRPGTATQTERPAPVGLGGIELRLIDAGLRDAVTLLANGPNGRVALTLAEVPFGDLMGWLDGIEDGAGYRINALQVERSAPGEVDAELQLEPLR